MFWNDADSFVRVLVMTPLAYTALILILRLSGKRMLSKMNAFDLVVTIALGSTLATIILSKEVALADGVAALAFLIGLQYIVAWSAARVGMVNRVIKSEPALLFYGGRFLRDALRRENVTEESVRAGIRQQGYGAMSEVAAVVLESDGTLSAVRRPDTNQSDTIGDVPKRDVARVADSRG